jgi:hypothetical protein
LYFVQSDLGVYDCSSPTVTRKLSVSLCIFRAPLHGIKAFLVLNFFMVNLIIEHPFEKSSEN